MTVIQAAWKMKDREGFGEEKLDWVGLKARSSMSHLMTKHTVTGPPTRWKVTVPRHLTSCSLAPSMGDTPRDTPRAQEKRSSPSRARRQHSPCSPPIPESQQSMPTGLEPPGMRVTECAPSVTPLNRPEELTSLGEASQSSGSPEAVAVTWLSGRC